ncbi:hypothetical protein H2200_009555 [Cladophialophora chaetospira]|uniref:Uncharacterized protein n=1 Tax=Cladophialophora chaetospira TaxID=386627 RepID=A0AA39CEW0_9EURO|nr:hypothetical protein H2200_009555 [Cladophialophora chaetospira]
MVYGISPEFLSGLAFGFVMLLLALIALWQNRRSREQQSTTTPPPMLPLYNYPPVPTTLHYHLNGVDFTIPSPPALYPWHFWASLFPTAPPLQHWSDWASSFAVRPPTHLPTQIHIDMLRTRLVDGQQYPPALPPSTPTAQFPIPVPYQITEVEEEY